VVISVLSNVTSDAMAIGSFTPLSVIRDDPDLSLKECEVKWHRISDYSVQNR
jgi:hypothetical protein